MACCRSTELQTSGSTYTDQLYNLLVAGKNSRGAIKGDNIGIGS